MYLIDIADDHPLVRDAIGQLLHQQVADCQVRLSVDFPSLWQQLLQGPEPDLVLLDLQMPGCQGFDGLQRLQLEFPQIPVAILSANDDKPTMLAAMTHGAIGFISKSSERAQLVQAVQQLLQGEVYLSAAQFRSDTPKTTTTPMHQAVSPLEWKVRALTAQQQRVLQWLLKGLSNKAIARELHCAETTVKTHVSVILEKFAVKRRAELLALFAMNAD
jgi:DNA-binding NarL/FixJ family response regulator